MDKYPIVTDTVGVMMFAASLSLLQYFTTLAQLLTVNTCVSLPEGFLWRLGYLAG